MIEILVDFILIMNYSNKIVDNDILKIHVFFQII